MAIRLLSISGVLGVVQPVSTPNRLPAVVARFTFRLYMVRLLKKLGFIFDHSGRALTIRGRGLPAVGGGVV